MAEQLRSLIRHVCDPKVLNSRLLGRRKTAMAASLDHCFAKI